MTKQLGIDVSRYQGDINWDTVKSRGVEYAGIRVSISWAYVDNMAQANIEQAIARGIPVLPYWVLYPNEDAQKQVEHYYNTLRKFGLDIAKANAVIDVELHAGAHACTAAKYQAALSNALVYSKTLTGKAPIIYSRASFIDSYVTGRASSWTAKAPSWYNNYYWWLAQYLSSGAEHPGPVKLPAGVDRSRCIIHQTTDKGNGAFYGVQSASIDLNRWQMFTAPADWLLKGGAEPVQETVTLESLAADIADLQRRMALLENC